VASDSGRLSSTSVDVTERVQRILASKGLSLYQASQQSKAFYGKSSPYFLPHNLYYDLRQQAFTPTIYQVFALSHISNYCFPDWLRVFGIEVEDIPRLQAQLPRKRTALIDKTLMDRQARVPWFRSRGANNAIRPIAPLSQVLQQTGPRKIVSLLRADTQKFLYAKIGADDALAFPDLLPGSIVRANAELIGESFPSHDDIVSKRIFLFEHSKGLFCSRIRRVSERVIVPVGTQLSFGLVELKLQLEAKLLGVVDHEIRSLANWLRPEVPNDLAKLWKPRSLLENKSIHQFLTLARSNAGLSYREASLESQRVSDALNDARHRLAASSICDYETRGTPPRGLHKLVTLCCVYGLSFASALKSIGISLDQAGTEAMPDSLIERAIAEPSEGIPAIDTGLLEHLLETVEEVPFFLRRALAPLIGMRDVSIDNLFWIGGDHRPLNPYLTNGLLAVINHRRKAPAHFPPNPYGSSRFTCCCSAMASIGVPAATLRTAH